MFLSILNNRTGEEYIRQLGPNSHLELREYVRQWADEYDCKPAFSEPGSHIFNGCADYQAEIRRTKKSGASCWTSEPFYLNCEESE